MWIVINGENILQVRAATSSPSLPVLWFVCLWSVSVHLEKLYFILRLFCGRAICVSVCSINTSINEILTRKSSTRACAQSPVNWKLFHKQSGRRRRRRYASDAVIRTLTVNLDSHGKRLHILTTSLPRLLYLLWLAIGNLAGWEG